MRFSILEYWWTSEGQIHIKKKAFDLQVHLTFSGHFHLFVQLILIGFEQPLCEHWTLCMKEWKKQQRFFYSKEITNKRTTKVTNQSNVIRRSEEILKECVWMGKKDTHTLKIEIETETEETTQFETNYFNCNSLPVEFQAVFFNPECR